MKESKKLLTAGIFLFLLAASFIFSCKVLFKVQYNELQGTHSWLSGSTIKFVNNWLLETPQKLHFVNFESPNSIEFNNLAERGPYISYPSGCTFFVYAAAKLLNKKTIGVSFLKHFQMLCFFLEVLLLGLFVFRFLTRIGLKSGVERIVIAVATATFWSWLPTNVWYLANVYFADQCVILFVMLFLLVEYECYCAAKKSNKIVLNALKSFVVFAGILIDYYFWILTFVAFMLNIIRMNREKRSIKAMTIDSLWYIVPVILGLCVFAGQLVSISDWRIILKNKFLFRAGIMKSEYNTSQFIANGLKENFKNAFGLSYLKLKWWILICLILILYIVTKSDVQKSFLTNNGLIIILGIVSPILQILFLKNHSAVHEFSQIKLGWIFAVLPVIVSSVCCKIKDKNNQSISFGNFSLSYFFYYFIISLLCLTFITEVPFSSRDFRNSRRHMESIDYHLAKILWDKTSYEDVCFSFNHSIPENPPQELSVSGKRVYKINFKNELNTKFPNLNSKAVKILIIDKKDSSGLNDEQIAAQNGLWASNEIFYEDERFCLLKITDLYSGIGDEIDDVFN